MAHAPTAQLGMINGHIVGRVLKEAMRRAMVAIRQERFIFEATAKQGYGTETMDDILTSADTRAQEIYLRTLRECFPDCGVIGEEDNLHIAPSGACTAYFTLDPLDGTRAFARRQSHGVGTMIALVDGDDVVCAYVGDINTNEVYGYRPESQRVFRISQLDSFEQLAFGSPWNTTKSYVLLRDPLDTYSGASRELVHARFTSHIIDGGSIGIWLARLWKREVAAALIPPSYETPWDAAPIIGISRMLDYAFLRPAQGGRSWERFAPVVSSKTYRRGHDLLIVHEKDLAAMQLP